MKREKQPSWWGPIACVLGAASWLVGFALIVIVRDGQSLETTGQRPSLEYVESVTFLVRLAVVSIAVMSSAGFALAIADLFRANRQRFWTFAALAICGIPGFITVGMLLMIALE